MSILNKLKLDKLKKITHREPEIRDFCIQTIRFKKFLENARAMLDLIEDGREKALGEYIFDRHYVVSLIDSVIERLGMMVYDACVLAPQSGVELYAGYDRHKLAAANLISGKSPAGKTGASETVTLTEPEYQLLSDALFWLNGKDRADAETVMAFMKQVFFHVIQGIEPTDAAKNRLLFDTSNVKATDMNFYIIDLWKDALAPPEKKRTARGFNCVPLKHLLMDADCGESKTGTGNSSSDPDWVAAVTEYQLSLNSLKPDLEFRLETLASGDAQSDFIFIFAGKSTNLDSLLPAGFHIEKAHYGQLAWDLDLSAKTIEDSLMNIGRGLFG